MTLVHWAWEMTGVYVRKAQVAEHTGCQGWANVTAGLRWSRTWLGNQTGSRNWERQGNGLFPLPPAIVLGFMFFQLEFCWVPFAYTGNTSVLLFFRMWAFSSSNVLLFCHNSSSFNILSLTHFLAPSGILPTLQCSGEASTVAWGPQSSARQSSKVCRSTTDLWQIPPALAALVDEFIFPFSDCVVRREKQQPRTLKI